MRYILVLHDPTDLEDLGLVVCEDMEEVAAGIQEAESGQLEWHLFEIVNGKAEQRSICFEADKVIKSVQ